MSTHIGHCWSMGTNIGPWVPILSNMGLWVPILANIDPWVPILANIVPWIPILTNMGTQGPILVLRDHYWSIWESWDPYWPIWEPRPNAGVHGSILANMGTQGLILYMPIFNPEICFVNKSDLQITVCNNICYDLQLTAMYSFTANEMPLLKPFIKVPIHKLIDCQYQVNGLNTNRSFPTVVNLPPFISKTSLPVVHCI